MQKKRRINILLGILGIGAGLSCLSFFFSLNKGPVSAAETMLQTYDLVIKHAQILDGTGEKAVFRGDIAIKGGKIAKVGYVSENELKGLKKVPVFDAGGLTVMPFPLSQVHTQEVVEHLFCTSYPRYPAQYLFFQEGEYAMQSLLQVAKQRGETAEKTFATLRGQLPVNTKVYLLPLQMDENKLAEGSYPVEQLVAFQTGDLASAMGSEDAGRIKEGCTADLYFFIAHHYDEKSLQELLLKGELPTLALSCKEGKLSRQ